MGSEYDHLNEMNDMNRKVRMDAAMKRPFVAGIEGRFGVAKGLAATRETARPSGASGRLVTEFSITGFDRTGKAQPPLGHLVSERPGPLRHCRLEPAARQGGRFCLPLVNH